jgi:hypothetical protein
MTIINNERRQLPAFFLYAATIDENEKIWRIDLRFNSSLLVRRKSYAYLKNVHPTTL